VYCLAVVFFRNRVSGALNVTRQLEAASYVEYIRRFVFAGKASGLFTILLIFVALGGLLRERARGTAPFTLALPKSRRRIAGVRAAVGLLEMMVLALLPVMIVAVCSPLLQQRYPVSESLRFSLGWIGGGSVIFALTFLLSSLLSGEFTALVSAYIILVLHTFVAVWEPLKPYHLNVMQTIGGRRMLYENASGELLLGPVPWTRLLILVLVAATMLAVSFHLTERRDF
jgi:ABC-type transport system involved in multi-copper enzyme maturation permease subunit